MNSIRRVFWTPTRALPRFIATAAAAAVAAAAAAAAVAAAAASRLEENLNQIRFWCFCRSRKSRRISLQIKVAGLWGSRFKFNTWNYILAQRIVVETVAHDTWVSWSQKMWINKFCLQVRETVLTPQIRYQFKWFFRQKVDMVCASFGFCGSINHFSSL